MTFFYFSLIIYLLLNSSNISKCLQQNILLKKYIKDLNQNTFHHASTIHVKIPPHPTSTPQKGNWWLLLQQAALCITTYTLLPAIYYPFGCHFPLEIWPKAGVA